MAWRGLWAGFAFFGLTYLYARIFATTSVTEPLGLIWALLSVPCFINSFRTGSQSSALAGFAMTTVALFTRMGNMFAIPGLMAWVVWQFGNSLAARMRVGLLAIGILLAVLGLNSMLAKTYGSVSGFTGGNFSYAICGLTLGTNWEGCDQKLRASGKDRLPERERSTVLYTMAWDNFRADPTVFFNRLVSGTLAFYSALPETIWTGYGNRVDQPHWFARRGLALLIAIGIFFVAARRATKKELTFWVFFWASLTASAAFVFFDDGPRVLAASFPLIALFLSTGFANPTLSKEQIPLNRSFPLYNSLGLVLAAFCLATLPWLAHRNYPAFAASFGRLSSSGEDVLVFGGKRMSGFLVVADGDPLRDDIATIHYSDFENIVAQSRVENQQGLLNPISPPVPFGFVYAPRMEPGTQSVSNYIVPLKVLEQRAVLGWRFKVNLWRHKVDVVGNNHAWFYVTEATPWPIGAQ